MASRTGRRTKRSPEREQAILNALKIGNTRRAAAAGAGISHELFYQWLDDLTFLDAVTKAEAEAEQRFLGQVAQAARTSWQAATWWLERRRGEDYRQRSGVEVTGAEGGPVEIVTATFSDHEREVLSKLLREAAEAETVDAGS